MNEPEIELVGTKKNIVMDATILTALMNCARAADFSYNHNFRPIKGKSNSLETGSIVHAFLEGYYKAIVNRIPKRDAISYGNIAAELYIQSCKHCTGFIPTAEIPKPTCGHQPDQYPGVVNTPKESEGYVIGWNWALDTCNQYIEFYRTDYWVPLEVEKVKSKILYEDEEIRILWKAKLDLVADTNQGIYPIDHKTAKQRRDTLKLNNQFIGQCLIQGTRNAIINKIGFQTSLKPEEKFTRQVMSYSPEHLLEWQSEILPYYAKMLIMWQETGYFPPNYTQCENKYGLCQYNRVCAGNPEDRERLIKVEFVIGREWNPMNDSEE